MKKRVHSSPYLKHFISFFGSLKKRKLFGSFMLSYKSLDEYYHEDNLSFLVRNNYIIRTNKVKFSTTKLPTEFMEGLKLIHCLPTKKNKYVKELVTKESLEDIFIEDYFKNHPNEIVTKHTDVHYKMVGGVITTTVGLMIFFCYLTLILPIKALLLVAIVLGMFISYAEYKTSI